MEGLPKRKKKVDYEALHSPLSRIPGMDLRTVRALLNQEIDDLDALRGRSPESLFANAVERNPGLPEDVLYALRLAVYYAETPEPDPALLAPWKWKD